MSRIGREHPVHLSHRAGWLRAAVLGANDGIVSTASLVLGVAAAGGSTRAVATAGIAGLVAGALSMAAGEYVSVSSQLDTERADLRLEERELADDPEGEVDELADIYERRGLSRPLARQVAVELSKGDRLAVHARDELGLESGGRARPFQAAWTSALSFTAGASLPLLAISVAPTGIRVIVCVASTLMALGLLGQLGARLGGAPRLKAVVRVVGWGAVAMAVTSGIGALTGSVV
ncbi:MAG: VIT family protein [Actinomycetota bacterium]|nr:VIT family protein [Actinomycetota bacterium]